MPDLNEMIFGIDAGARLPTGADVNDPMEFIARALARGREASAELATILGDVQKYRDTYRERLIDDGQIRPIAKPGTSPNWSIAAVDGGYVLDPLYAADLITAVAACGGPINADQQEPLISDAELQVLPHAASNGLFAQALMFILELSVLNRITHQLRIVDGSLVTALIAVTEGLYISNPDTRRLLIQYIQDKDLLNTVHILAKPPNGSRVVALPKADTGDVYVKEYRARYGLASHAVDKMFAAQILDHGEFLIPKPLTEQTLFRTGRTIGLADDAKPVHAALDDAFAPLKQAARDGTVHVTYIKPETADTAIKMQFLTKTADPGLIVSDAAILGRILSDQTPGPDLMEPLPQYAADLAAKNVATTAQAFRQSLLMALPDDARDNLALLMRSYRTGRG